MVTMKKITARAEQLVNEAIGSALSSHFRVGPLPFDGTIGELADAVEQAAQRVAGNVDRSETVTAASRSVRIRLERVYRDLSSIAARLDGAE